MVWSQLSSAKRPQKLIEIFNVSRIHRMSTPDRSCTSCFHPSRECRADRCHSNKVRSLKYDSLVWYILCTDILRISTSQTVRHALRFTPVTDSCAATLPEIIKLAERLLPPAFECATPGTGFKVRIPTRSFSAMNSSNTHPVSNQYHLTESFCRPACRSDPRARAVRAGGWRTCR